MFNNQNKNIFNQNTQNKSNIFMNSTNTQGGNNMFNNNQSQGTNPFNNGGQTQGNNMFTNQGNIFANKGNQPNNNIFAQNQNQNQGTNNIFNQNQNQGNNMFNQNQGNNIFNQGQNNQGNMFNNQNPQGNNMFNNTNTGGNNMFNNNTQGGNNMFSNNNNQTQGNNIFSQNQGNNIFNNQGRNIFNNQGNNTQGNNIFNNQAQGQSNNIFNQNRTNQPVGGGNIFNQGQNQNPLFNTGNIQFNQMSQRYSSLPEIEENKLIIQECRRKLDKKNLSILRLDNMNIFKQQKVGSLPQFKPNIIIVLNNMRELKNFNEQIKKQIKTLDDKAAQYCKLVHSKLMNYKECLIQNIEQSNMVQDVKKQLQAMENQLNNFLVPLYNAFKSNKHYPLEDPDQFCVNINRQILKRMTILNSKVDDILACQNQEDALSMENSDTINVIEQLLEYYQNVSCKVRQFSTKYEILKKRAIQTRRSGSLSSVDVMKRIQDKVKNSMSKDFRSYDLLKQIEAILEKREKKETQEKVQTTRRQVNNGYY